MNQKNSSIFTLAALFSVLAAPSGFSAEVSWTGDGDGSSFTDGDNWSSDTVPAALDEALFRRSAAVTLSSDPTVITNIRVQATSLNANVSVDTGVKTLTLTGAEPIRVADTASGAGSGSLTLSGSFVLTAEIAEVDARRNSSLVLSGATISSNGGPLSEILIGNVTGGGAITFDSSTIGSGALATAIEDGMNVRISNANTISSTVLALNNGGLSFESNSDSLSANSILATNNGGTWLFDLQDAVTDSAAYIVAGSLNLTEIDLDVSNLAGADVVNNRNPIILAQYTGSLTGEFANISGVWPGMNINYNYQGMGLIAIVPEPSLALPILAGFLPLFGFRRRSRR